MRRLFTILALTALVGGMSIPVAAGADQGVTARRAPGALIFISADVSLPGPFAGDFTARGGAVNRDIVCPSGSVAGDVTGEGGRFFDFKVSYTFTCDDDTGTFGADLWVRWVNQGTLFLWSVTGGTDDYVGLSGGGIGFGRQSPLGEDIVRDTYMGWVSG